MAEWQSGHITVTASPAIWIFKKEHLSGSGVYEVRRRNVKNKMSSRLVVLFHSHLTMAMHLTSSKVFLT